MAGVLLAGASLADAPFADVALAAVRADDARELLLPVEHRGPAERPCEVYPLHLTTGRVLAHDQSGAQTRRVRALVDAESPSSDPAALPASDSIRAIERPATSFEAL